MVGDDESIDYCDRIMRFAIFVAKAFHKAEVLEGYPLFLHDLGIWQPGGRLWNGSVR